MSKLAENIFLIIGGALTIWCILFVFNAPNAGLLEKVFALLGYSFTYYLSFISFKGAN